jgi:LacI family transcriptional regulator/LacI family repressor for deo operon, udp, cdd, tsx, nupC, and nupG
LGVKIPDEFSICGYNGIDLDSFYPSITSVKQNPELIAKTMFDLIVAAKKNPPPAEIIIDVNFLPGDTCRKIDL